MRYQKTTEKSVVFVFYDINYILSSKYDTIFAPYSVF